MSDTQYTKEQIANIAADILELYGEKTYPIKVVALAEAMGLSVYDATFEDFLQCFEIKQVAFLYYSAEKIFTILSAIMMILLSFPTAKGIRRLFRAMIERISKKHT